MFQKRFDQEIRPALASRGGRLRVWLSVGVVAGLLGTGAARADFEYSLSFDFSVTITGYTGDGGAVTVPETLLGFRVVTIGAGAFAGETSITSLSLPASVSRIQDNAFANNGNLAGVYFYGNAPQAGAGLFTGASPTVYRLASATGWASTFAGRPATVFAAPVLTVTPPLREVDQDAGSATFEASNAGGGMMVYEASESSAWLWISGGGKGTNAGTLAVSFSANTAIGARTGTVQVAAANAGGSPVSLSVVQRAGPVLAISPASTNLSGLAVEGRQIQVVANREWTAVSTSDWLTVESATPGEGGGVVLYGVSENTGDVRTAAITLAGGGLERSFSVVQAAAGPALEIEPETWVQPDSGAGTVEVAVRANVDWTAAAADSWLTIVDGVDGSGYGAFRVDIQANAGETSRTGTVAVAGGSLERLFTVIQNGTLGGRLTVRITRPTLDDVYTSTRATLDLGGTAGGADGVERVVVRNFRDVADYPAAGTTAWQLEGLPLYQGPNVITVTAYDAAGASVADTIQVAYEGDGQYEDVLRSGAVMQDVDFPDNLTPGSTVTVRWKVLSYVPVRSRLYAGVSGGWRFFKEGTYVGYEESPWNLDGRHAGVYAFESTWPVPQHSGTFQVWFNVAQMDAFQFMIPVVPDGVDQRPDPAFPKLLQRTILQGGSGEDPESDDDLYDESLRFESLEHCRMRSGATVTTIRMLDNLTPGERVEVDWSVLSYEPVNAQVLMVNQEQGEVWATADAVQVGQPKTSTYVFRDRETGERQYATETSFQAVLTVPNQPGTQQVYFRCQAAGASDSPWMAATLSAEIDSRPAMLDGIYGRYIERTIRP